MRKVMSMILAAALTLGTLTGCGNSAGKETTKASEAAASPESRQENTSDSAKGRKTKITVGLTNYVKTMSPWVNTDPYNGIVFSEVYQHLGQRDEVGSENFIGVLMKEWEVVDDCTYKIKLYDYIKDSAGNPIKASDVVYSFDSCKSIGTTASGYVDSVTADGDYELTLVLNNPGVGIFEYVCEGIWIASEAAVEATADKMATQPVGTGPYICKEFVANSYIILEKNENYWQTDELNPKVCEANVDVIEYNFLNETTQMGIAVESGTVQMAMWLNESLIEDARKVPGLVVNNMPSIQMRCIMFNMTEESPFYDNLPLRQAVCYAIDNTAVVNASLYGVGFIPKTWGNKAAIGYNEAWEREDYYNYNVEKAKELLNEAGYKPGELTLEFWTSSNKVNENCAQIFMACMKEIGINVNYSEMDSTTHVTQMNDPYSGWDIDSADSSLLGAYMIQTYSYWCDNTLRGTGRTYFGLKDDHLQSLVEKCQSKDWKQEDLDELNSYVVDNCYIYQWCGNYFTAAYVEGVEETYNNYRNDLVVGACTFSDDWSYFAD